MRHLSLICLTFVMLYCFPSSILAQAPAFGSTPLADLNKYPKSPHNIQVTSYLIFHKPAMDLYKQYLAKEIDYLWLDQSSLTVQEPSGAYSFSQLFTSIAELKNLNPAIKIGVHGGGGGYVAPYHLPHNYITESDLLHSPSGTILRFSADSRNYFLNLGNPATRQKIANAWGTLFTENPGLTGINLDGYLSYHTDPALANGCREGACNTRAYWIDNMTTLSRLIKSTIPTGKEVTYNGLMLDLDPATTQGTMNSGFITDHDGVLSEHPHTMLYSPENFKTHMDTMQTILNSGKKLWFWVQPKIISLHNPNFAFTNDLNLQRFFLTTYLLIQKTPLTYFGYHPGDIYSSDNGVYFYQDWNRDYGLPTGAYQLLGSGLYTRAYANGLAVLNPTTSAKSVVFSDTAEYTRWTPGEGTKVKTSDTIAPRTGVFYFRLNTSSKPGDLNNDGYTNIFDYNLLVSKFNNPYTIFDYNILVANYGK